MGASVDDFYEVLGVDPRSTATEVRRAWRRLALRWHPDRAGAEATRTFQKIAAAYAVLSDPAARAAYDVTHRAAARRRSTETARPHRAPNRRAPAVMLSRVTGSLESLMARGLARRDGDVIELHLDAAESAQGGMAMISMYVDIRCPACAGHEPARCTKCGAARLVKELFSAWLAVPPGVADGTLLAPSVELPGMMTSARFRVRTP